MTTVLDHSQVVRSAIKKLPIRLDIWAVNS